MSRDNVAALRQLPNAKNRPIVHCISRVCQAPGTKCIARVDTDRNGRITYAYSIPNTEYYYLLYALLLLLNSALLSEIEISVLFKLFIITEGGNKNTTDRKLK